MCKNKFLVFVGIILIVSLMSGCFADEKKLWEEEIFEEQLSGEEIYERLSASTVEITAESNYVSSLGSGFFVDEKGTVVTNYHVIKDCTSAKVTANDDRVYDVTSILGYSEDLDIAILATSKKTARQ